MPTIYRPLRAHQRLTTDFVDNQLRLYPEGTTFADKQPANNKLAAAYDEVNPSLISQIGAPLCQVVTRSRAQLGFVASVPSGGDGWASFLTSPQCLDRPYVEQLRFDKLPESRREFAPTDDTRQRIGALAQAGVAGVVIDDATTSGETSLALARLLVEQYDLSVELIVSVFVRGKLSELVGDIPRGVVLAREIPRNIDIDQVQATGRITPL